MSQSDAFCRMFSQEIARRNHVRNSKVKNNFEFFLFWFLLVICCFGLFLDAKGRTDCCTIGKYHFFDLH